MVAHLLKLQLALQKAGFRRNAWAIVGMVFGLIYALGAAAMLIVGALFLRTHSADVVGPPTVLIWSLVTLGWCLLPLLAFGVDETLDPARFALFPLRARDLMPGLLLGGFLSAGGVLNLLCGAAFVIAWTGHLVAALVAVVMGLVGILTCFLFSRALTSSLASGLVKRKTRDLAAVMLGIIGMTFGLGMQFVSRGLQGSSPEQILAGLRTAASVLAWTPFGWAWAVPWDVATGRWALAGIRALLALALVACLWFAWQHFLAIGLTSPIDTGGDGGKVSAHSRIDRMFPATPRGAIAARSLRYWRRDSRHVIALVSILMMPALILVPMYINNRHGNISPLGVLFAPAIIGMMAGIGLSNEIAYDGSALWTHISTGVRGIDDRIGRAWALSTILVPIMMIAVVGSLILSRGWWLAPAMIGATIAIYLNALGIGGWLGSIFIVPTPPPGQRNAFNRGQSGGINGFLNLLGTWVGTIIPALPTLALAIASLWMPWLGWVALLVGALTGALVAWLGLRAGGKRLDTHWPEALKAATYEAH